jgi:hypothetical protein
MFARLTDFRQRQWYRCRAAVMIASRGAVALVVGGGLLFHA